MPAYKKNEMNILSSLANGFYKSSLDNTNLSYWIVDCALFR